MVRRGTTMALMVLSSLSLASRFFKSRQIIQSRQIETLSSRTVTALPVSKSSSIAAEDSEKNKNLSNTAATPKWVPVDNPRDYVYPSGNICCGSNPATFRNFPEQCGTQSMPEMKRRGGTSFSGRTDYLIHVQEKDVCGCKHYVNGTEAVPMRFEAPGLPTWNVAQFCSLLSNRRILLIGDSVMNQLAVTLMNAVFPEQCVTQLSYASSDTLVAKKFGYGGNRGLHYRNWIEEYNFPEIVLLSTGNHQVGIKLEEFEEYWKNLLADMEDFYLNLKSMNDTTTTKSTTLVWVTQTGHGCARERIPNFATNWNWTAYEKLGFSKHDYDQFLPRDESFIKPALKQRHWPFIDLQMLLERTDSHVDSFIEKPHKWADCTHYCMPGPLDVFPQLVLQYLMNSSSEQRTVGL